ncbi:MAG: sodium:solute symporter, partial [Ignavibacteria bacterium]|nr:sodium:solute symporter [Ignavibacteria bacterium]
NTNDLDQIFLTFVTSYLPKGLIGLLIAVIISASMSSASSILNALAGTSVIDIYKRVISKKQNEAHYLKVSKYFTVFWGLIAILFALYANNVGNLIQALNILGSLFYGSILGIFLAAFYFKRIRGNSIFSAAIVAQILVFLCFIFSNISFLWFNVIGCVAVILFGYMFQFSFFRSKPLN